MAARAVEPARDAVPRAQPQAGLAHPVSRRPAQPERDRPGLVRRPARRPADRRPARSAPRDAPDVAGRGRPPPPAAGARRRVASRHTGWPGSASQQVAELLGEELLRATNPIVATYARVEAVDVRISAVADGDRSADELVEAATTLVLGQLGDARLGDRRDDLERGDRRAARGTRLDARHRRDRDRREPGGPVRRRALGPFRRIDRARGAGGAAHATAPDQSDADSVPATTSRTSVPDDLERFARRARELGGAEVGLAVRARPRTGDTAVSIAISTPTGERRVRRIVFLTGPMGRSRAALAAAAVLLETLREVDPAP